MHRIVYNMAISIHNKTLVNSIKEKLTMHHQLYRTPVKDVYLEDIFDQCINPNNSTWKPNGHQSGADTKLETENLTECYQNKSGQLLENKTKVRISSHRTSKYKTLEDKINFISKKHCDKYVLLSRDEKEWEVGKKIYYLMIFDSSLFDFKNINWSDKITIKGKNKGQQNGGFVGNDTNNHYRAEILNASTSNQLWIIANIDYIGGFAKIDVGET